jgi:hypothetical protein
VFPSELAENPSVSCPVPPRPRRTDCSRLIMQTNKVQRYLIWALPRVARPLGLVVAMAIIPAGSLLAAALLAEHPGWLRPFIQWWGVVLQLVGFGLVWNQLRSALKEYGRPNWKTRISAWWNARPGVTHHLVAKGIVAGAPTVGSPLLRDRRGKGDGSVEARLAALEYNLDALQTEADTAPKEESDRLRVLLRAEEHARKETDQHLGDRIEEQAVGSPDVQIASLLFFVSGVIWATAPDDLIRVAKAIFRAS